jgi:dCMP deaminase
VSPVHSQYLAEAIVVASRANCIRRTVGALIVRDGCVIARGWNGVFGTFKDCREAGCPRCIAGGSTGSGYATCVCIHAEQSAIADAARRGISADGSTIYVTLRPCLQCMAIALAAGIMHLYYATNVLFTPDIEAAYATLSSQFKSFGSALDLPPNS